MTAKSSPVAPASARGDRAWRGGAVLLLILLGSLAARLWYSSANPFSYDETHNLMIGALASQGYAPYREIYSVIAPFALLTMRAAATLWDTTHWVRMPVIVYGLAGVAALYYLTWRHTPRNGILAAGLAAVFFSFNPHFFFVSTSINLEAGALGLGLIAVAIVEHYRTRPAHTRSTLWLLLAGAVFGLSTTFKVFVPFVPAVIALQLFLILTVDRERSLRSPGVYGELLKLGLVCAAGVLLVIALLLLTFDRAPMLEQVIGSRFVLREAIETDEAGVNIAEALTGGDLLQYVPLTLGALIGLAAVWRQRLAHAWIWPLWFVLAAAFLLSHDPVRPRHTVMILPPLAALSGIGLAWLATSLAQQKPALARRLNPLAATGVLAWAILAPLPLIEIETFTEKHPVRQAAIDFVQQTTAPADCIISKENRLHFLAGRLSTPHLSLISTARLFSGLLPAAAIAAEIEQHDCPVLVYTDTFDRLIPDLRQELDRLYALKLTLVDPREPDYPLEVYAVKQNTQAPPPVAQAYRLGDRIAFLGYGLSAGPWQPGQTVHLSAYWQAVEQMDHEYKIFIHLVDSQGNAVATFDHYPFTLREEYLAADVELNAIYRGNPAALPAYYPATGMIPTSLWQPGETLVETVALPLPADLPPGAYTLALGLYDENSMERLTVTGAPDGPYNQITLGPVQVIGD